MNDKKSMHVYTGLWAIIAVAYGLWMSVFMRWDQYPYIIPTDADMALPSEAFIEKFDGMLYGPMYPNAAAFWLWVIGSTALLFLTYSLSIESFHDQQIQNGTLKSSRIKSCRPSI